MGRHIANVKQNNTYQYLYTHKGEHSLTEKLNGPHGVDHADELFLQFYPFVKDVVKLNENDQSMSKILMSLWKSFIKHGNPSTDEIIWQPIISSTERDTYI